MKTLKTIGAIALAAAIGTPAFAQDADEGFYGTIGLELFDLGQRDDPSAPFLDNEGVQLRDDNGDLIFDQKSQDVVNLFGRVGYDLSEFFALEAEGRFSILDDNASDDSTDAVTLTDTRVTFGVAGFAVGKLPLNDNFDVIGRVGYHYTEARASSRSSFPVNANLDGYALGGGFQYTFGELLNSRVRLEYTLYDNTEDRGNADAYQLSFTRRF